MFQKEKSMDPIKILKRAWHILWQYRALWIFGLIIAIAAAGSSGGGGNNGVRFDAGENYYRSELDASEDFREALDEAGEALHDLFENGIPETGISKLEWSALIWVGGAFILLLLVYIVAVTIARYVSETALIRMVDHYEATDTKMTVGEGFRIGWSRTSWRLFLINLILHIPGFLLFIVLGAIGWLIFTQVAWSEPNSVAGLVALIGAAFLVIFLMIMLGVVIQLLRKFFWRVCAIEEAGVQESFQKGFAIFREHWKNIGIMWLVMIGLGILWAILSLISIVVLLPLVAITAIVAALIAVVPGLLLVALFSLFLSGPLPWIVAAIFIIPLFSILAFSPWMLLSTWQAVFTSSVWTLVYREIKALPLLETVSEIEPEPVV
jgi:hypothetical protein